MGRALSLALIVIAFSAPGRAFAGEDRFVHWTRSLSELGYQSNLEAEGLRGTIEAKWPLPSLARSAVLHLRLAARSPPGLTVMLTATIEGQAVRSERLPGGLQKKWDWVLAVPDATIQKGDVNLGLELRAASSGHACRDQALGAVKMSLDPQSFIEVEAQYPRTLNEALDLLPETVSLAPPPGDLAFGQIARVLELAAVFAKRGHRIALSDESEAAVVLREGLHPFVLVSRPKAAPRIVLALEGAYENLVPPKPSSAILFENGTIAFATDRLTRAGYPDAVWSTDLALQDLPRDRVPASLLARYDFGPDDPRLHHIAHLSINGAVAASVELRPGRESSIELPVPVRSLSGHMRLGLMLERRSVSGCIDDPPPLSVTLRSGARLILAPPPLGAAQFYQLSSGMNGLTIFIQRPSRAQLNRDLPILAALLRALWHAGEPLSVQSLPDGRLQPQTRFIVISERPPLGVALPLALKNEPLTVATRSGRPVVTLDPQVGGFAMLTKAADQSGLWLAPPKLGAFQLRPAESLDQGDVAVFDEHGVAFWWNSTAARGLVAQPVSSAATQKGAGRITLFALALLWGLVTLLVLIALVRRAVRR